MRRTKLGRNDPCHCGSGKKYKKCHMGADQKAGPGKAAPPARRPGRRERARKRAKALILTPTEQDGMRAAGKFNAQVLDEVRKRVAPGVTLEAIDTFVHDYTLDHGHQLACLGYKGYPKSTCTSVNDVVCHGIPDDYALREGDIVNIDLTSIVDGWHGDQSETFLIGDVSDEARRLVQCSFDCLHLGIDALKPGSQVIEIGRAIAKHAHAQGFSVVEAFQGHGIGRKFHTEPGVPHYPEPHAGQFVLLPGMCFTIEPMINAGRKGCVIDKSDGWTARTVDGKLSAQFEHTILMTNKGPELVTLTRDGPQRGHTF